MPREMPDDSITMAFQLVSDLLKSASLGEAVEIHGGNLSHLTMKENGREAVNSYGQRTSYAASSRALNVPGHYGGCYGPETRLPCAQTRTPALNPGP